MDDEPPFWCVDCLIDREAGQQQTALNAAVFLIAGTSVCERHAKVRLADVIRERRDAPRLPRPGLR